MGKIGLKLACLLGFSAISGAASAAAPPTQPRILWDQYAVPHIYGADIPTVARGLGYATMENQAELLLRKIARARGRLAEYFGATSPEGEDYVAADTMTIQSGIQAIGLQWAGEVRPSELAIMEAFCDGVNQYATRHKRDINAKLLPILPMVPSDITAIGAFAVLYNFDAGQSSVPYLLQHWQQGGAVAAPALAPRRPGSNAIVIGPSKSADGNPIIVSNSHLPWSVNSPLSPNSYVDFTGWFEANLIVGAPDAPQLNAAGVTWPGLPFLVQGFSDAGGWSNTANNLFNADLYQLTLDSTGTKYLYGGQYLPLKRGSVALKVRAADGTLTTISVPTASSIHGPLVALSPDHGKALALRLAGIHHADFVAQYWGMLQAQTLQQFKAAVSALDLPMFNIFYANRNGNIYYLYNGLIPERGCPFAVTYASEAGTLVPPIEDGTNPACLWTKNLAFRQLPQASNPPGGYFANGNEAPWYASFPQPAGLNPAAYPAYVAPDGMDMRPQHTHLWLNAATALTPQDVLAGKNSTHMTLADRVLPDLLSLANQAAAGGDTVAGRAAAILSAWDRTADEASVGGVLFEAWWDLVAADAAAGNLVADHSLDYSGNPHPQFRLAFDPANPLTTPVGLAPVNNARLLADLEAAYTQVSANFAAVGGAVVPWGAAHKTTLVARYGAQQQGLKMPLLVNDPLSGADDPFGALRVVDSAYVPPLSDYVSYGGESYIHVVEFTPGGAVGGSLLVYGNSTRPNSTHIADQSALFRQKALKPELRTFAAVKAATVRTEIY